MPLPPLKATVPNTTDPQAVRQALAGVREDLRRRAGVSLGGYILIDSEQKIAWQSPDGHWWEVTIDNAGAITTTDLGTTPP